MIANAASYCTFSVLLQNASVSSLSYKISPLSRRSLMNALYIVTRVCLGNLSERFLKSPMPLKTLLISFYFTWVLQLSFSSRYNHICFWTLVWVTGILLKYIKGWHCVKSITLDQNNSEYRHFLRSVILICTYPWKYHFLCLIRWIWIKIHFPCISTIFNFIWKEWRVICKKL